MSDEDPREVLARLIATMEPLLEDPVFAERVARQAMLYRDKAVREPNSLREELRKMHSQPGLSGSTIQRWRDVGQQLPPPSPDFGFFPAARDFFALLQRAQKFLPPLVVHEQLSKTLAFDWRITRAGLIESMRPDDSVGFESRCRTLSEVLRSAAESWYKPILMAALNLSNASRSRGNASTPNELGALMAACRSSNDVPASLLFDEMRMIRNATAHSQLEFDLSNERITYVNHARNGQRQILGPKSWTEVCRIADDFLNLCWASTIVCMRMHRLTAAPA